MEPTQNQESNSLPSDAPVVTAETEVVATNSLSQPVDEGASANVTNARTSLPIDTSPEQGILDKSSKGLLYACMSLFGISSLGGILSFIFRPFASLTYLWFIAVLVSLFAVVTLFFTGLYQGFSSKKTFRLVGTSILFLLTLTVVGAGTCLLNTGGM